MRFLIFFCLPLCSLAVTCISSSNPKDLAIDPQGSQNVNGGSFQQEALVTFGNYQYASFYTQTAYEVKHVNLARRQISPSVGQWDCIVFNDYVQSIVDGHRQISLGISGDGRIHLSFDHHDNPLNYRISNSGIALSIPSNWTAELFGSVLHTLPGSTGPWTPVTYPRFEPIGAGDLLCESRIGGSGDGSQYLHRYSSSTGQWSPIAKYITSADNNAYLNGIHYSNGRLFISWTVRETPNANTNHDFYFAYSDNLGQSWFNTNGTGLPTPFLVDNNLAKVYSIPQNSQLVNQEGQIVDSSGRFHALMRDNTTGISRYYHYYRDLTGYWIRRVIPATQNSPPTLYDTRGKLAIDNTGKNLFAILPDTPNQNARIYKATAGGDFQDWTLWQTITSNSGEPLFDRVRLKNFGILSVYIRTSAGFPSRTLQVWDFNI